MQEGVLAETADLDESESELDGAESGEESAQCLGEEGPTGSRCGVEHAVRQRGDVRGQLGTGESRDGGGRLPPPLAVVALGQVLLRAVAFAGRVFAVEHGGEHFSVQVTPHIPMVGYRAGPVPP